LGSRLRSFNFPVIFVSFCFSSNRLTVLQDRVHCYVPFWRTMAPRTVWSRKADSRLRQRLRLSIALWFRSRLRSFNFPVIFFSFASVPNDLPFCRTEFNATFRSDGPWPPERSEAEKLIRDDDNAFDFPLLSGFAVGYGPSISLWYFFLLLQFQTTYRSAGPSSLLRSDVPWPPERSEAEKLIRDDPFH